MDLDAKVALAQAASAAIATLPRVAASHVDDWNRFGSFALFIRLDCPVAAGCAWAVPEFPMRRVTDAIRAAVATTLGGHSYRLALVPPRRCYHKENRWQRPRQTFLGYESAIITVDLDLYG